MEDQGRRYEVIATLILDRSLCLPCIGAKASVSVDTTEKILETIGAALVLRREVSRCVACGETKLVYCVARRSSPTGRAANA